MNRMFVVVAAAMASACSSASSATVGAPAPAPVRAPAPAVPAPVASPAPPAPVIPATPARDTVVAVNPEGNYELQVVFGGSPTAVAMELYKENGAWHGTVGNPDLGSAAVTGLSQEGRRFRLTLAAQTGDAITLTFELKQDNTVTGTWSGLGDGSQLTGRKVR